MTKELDFCGMKITTCAKTFSILGLCGCALSFVFISTIPYSIFVAGIFTIAYMGINKKNPKFLNASIIMLYVHAGIMIFLTIMMFVLALEVPNYIVVAFKTMPEPKHAATISCFLLVGVGIIIIAFTCGAIYVFRQTRKYFLETFSPNSMPA